MKLSETKKVVWAAFLLVLGWVLPFFTAQIPEIGKMLLPMHIPVLLGGFLLGWKYGLLLGVLTPLLRSLFFTMPVMYPTAIAMAFELSGYGIGAACLYQKIPHSFKGICLSLVGSMLIGRVLWGMSMWVLLPAVQPFTFSMFLAGAFANALPGILLQFILIPMLVYIMQKEPIPS